MTTPTESRTVRPVDALEERETELGLARRFVRLVGDKFRFVPVTRTWFVWSDTHWARAQGGEVERAAKQVVDSLLLEVVTEPDPDRRRALGKFALAAQSARVIRNMLSLAETELGIALPPEALDRDPWALNCLNGTLDLKTGALREHRRADLISKLVPAQYDPAATCPTFEAFLQRIFDGKLELIGFVQRAAGYALTGDTREQVFFLCWGSGANGKSTLMGALAGLLSGYATTLDADTLLIRKGDRGLVLNDLSKLQGARFVVTVESDMGRKLAEATIKRLTGGERVPVKRLYVDIFDIEPTFKLWIGTNHRPVIRGTDHAIWRRIRLIPFDVAIPETEQDRQLADKLQAEAAGILRWAVEGCLAWQRGGLQAPPAVLAAVDDYRTDMDPLGGFLDARCGLEPTAVARAGALYKAYVAWAHAEGVTDALSARAFKACLTERGLKHDKDREGAFWAGIGLRPVPSADETPPPGWVTEP